MPYGQPKIPVMQVKQMILDEIKNKLEQNPLFQNDSIAFYNFSCNYSLDLTVTARATENFKVHGKASGGDAPESEKRGPVAEVPRVFQTKTSGEIKKPEAKTEASK